MTNVATTKLGIFKRHGHQLLCSDGIIRAATLDESPDTWFSVPAVIRIKGKKITGYYTAETAYSFTEQKEYTVCAFRHHTCHLGDLPPWPDKFTDEHTELIRKNATTGQPSPAPEAPKLSIGLVAQKRLRAGRNENLMDASDDAREQAERFGE